MCEESSSPFVDGLLESQVGPDPDELCRVGAQRIPFFLEFIFHLREPKGSHVGLLLKEAPALASPLVCAVTALPSHQVCSNSPGACLRRAAASGAPDRGRKKLKDQLAQRLVLCHLVLAWTLAAGYPMSALTSLLAFSFFLWSRASLQPCWAAAAQERGRQEAPGSSVQHKSHSSHLRGFLQPLCPFSFQTGVVL